MVFDPVKETVCFTGDDRLTTSLQTPPRLPPYTNPIAIMAARVGLS